MELPPQVTARGEEMSLEGTAADSADHSCRFNFGDSDLYEHFDYLLLVVELVTTSGVVFVFPLLCFVGNWIFCIN